MKDFRGDAAASQVESFDPTPENLDARTQLSTLPSGLKLALLPKGARGGVAHARLALRFGDVQTLQGFSTVSALGASLIDKGGAGLTRQQIRDRLDALRAQVSVGASDQGWSVNITTVRQHLPEVVRLVGQLLRQPAFPADALEEVRRQALSGLEQGRKEPGAVVADVLARHGNPYARGDLRPPSMSASRTSRPSHWGSCATSTAASSVRRTVSSAPWATLMPLRCARRWPRRWATGSSLRQALRATCARRSR
jgi:zinc protease